VLSSLVASLVGVASTYLLEMITEGVVCDLREQMFANLVGQSAGFYEARRGGELISGILNDVGAIDNLLAVSALSIVRYSISAVSTIALMFVLDWQLSILVLVLVLVPATLIPIRRAGRRIGAARLAVQQQLAVVTSYLHEVLGISGAQLVRAYARRQAERSRFAAT
jgi:ATP-binding cassette subfamily B protein